MRTFQLFQRLNHPYAATITTTPFGIGYAFSSKSFEDLVVLMAAGLVVDATRNAFAWGTNKYYELKPDITQLTGEAAYVADVLNQVKHRGQHSGQPIVLPVQETLEGKSAFEGGFFEVFDVDFDDASERVIYKKSHNEFDLEKKDIVDQVLTPNVSDGADYSEALHQMAELQGRTFNLVPRPYRPQSSTSRKLRRVENLGEFFPWVEGESLESLVDVANPFAQASDELFNKAWHAWISMQKVYQLSIDHVPQSDDSKDIQRLLNAPKHDSYHRLVNRVKNHYGEGEYWAALQKRADIFDNIPTVFIHGDLNHQNIKTNGPNVHVFDLDFGNQGFIYDDFLKVMMKTSSNNHRAFEIAKSTAMDQAKVVHDGLEYYHMHLLEYAQNMYYCISALETAKKADDPKLFAIAHSLLDQAQDSLHSYVHYTGDTEFQDIHNRFARELNYRDEMLAQDSTQVNLAYLHDQERKVGQDAVQLAVENKEGYKELMKDYTYSRSLAEHWPAALSAVGTIGLGAQYLSALHTFVTSDIRDEWTATFAGLTIGSAALIGTMWHYALKPFRQPK